MRRPPLLSIAVLLSAVVAAASACASAGGASAEPPRAPSSMRIASAGGMTMSINGMSGGGGVQGAIPAPIDSAWRLLPGVYQSLGIPLTIVADTARYLGNEGFKLRRSLGGQPLQKYLDCGNGSGGPNAETFDIRLAVFTQLRPISGTQAMASTSVQASARNPSFAGPEMACTSNGLLEQRINSLLERAVDR